MPSPVACDFELPRTSYRRRRALPLIGGGPDAGVGDVLDRCGDPLFHRKAKSVSVGRIFLHPPPRAIHAIHSALMILMTL